MCDSGSSISFIDKSVVSKLHFQGRKASLPVAGIHGSQDLKTEIVPIAVSAHEKSRPLTTVQFYMHERLKLGDQQLGAATRVERPLPTPEERSKSELHSKRGSNDSWTAVLRHSSPFWIQEVRRQSCTMGSEIKNSLGLKWSATSEAGSKSCHNSNNKCKW